MNHSVTREHEIACGHRVSGHEGKCRHLHGHNYRIQFTCQAWVANREDAHSELDGIGRVIDFGAIKALLCEWLEVSWDHKFLVWVGDSQAQEISMIDPSGVVIVPFNPSAENMAEYLVERVGPAMLAEKGVELVRVVIFETSKCSATYEKSR